MAKKTVKSKKKSAPAKKAATKKPVAKKAVANKKPVVKKVVAVKHEEVKKPVVSDKPMVKLHARDYRKMARETLKPYKGDFAVVYFLFFILISAVSSFIWAFSLIGTDIFPYEASVVGTGMSSALGGLVGILITGPLTFSFIHMARKSHRYNKTANTNDLFYGFKRFGHSIGVNVTATLLNILWTLLLIVPGIIKHYSYILTPYIAIDNPDMTPLACITTSRHLMKGHKWQYFCLWISHIGWYLLMIITLGILSFWVLPKLDQARFKFYIHISRQD